MTGTRRESRIAVTATAYAVHFTHATVCPT
jgi:hypothetical protein